MKNNFKAIIFYIILIAGIIFAANWLITQEDTEVLQYSDIVTLFKNEQVKEFTITTDNKLIYTLNDGTTSSFNLRSVSFFREDLGEIIDTQHEKGIITSYTYDYPMEFPWWVQYLPYIIMIIVFGFIWFFVMNQAMGKNGKISSFGKARAKVASGDIVKVLFTDVAGADEEKEELKEVVEFLKTPEKFRALGAKIPRGVLLMGPPGTGKTLLAKAVAGEAKVPFYSISGSDFVEMYVGVGASRVRDLFDTAKKTSPSIIFIDEIDAVGRHRGAGLGGGHDEREQTLNQLLVEMDGFSGSEGVIVIAATNRPDILDPALLRPGRFDRQITVNPPDLKGREDILKVHAKGKPFEETVSLEKIAQTTVGFTGADLANLLNEAALHAARKSKHLIGMEDIEEAALKIMVGTQKKSRKIKEAELKNTAYHEAGHAILAHILPSLDPVRQISIIPSGRALGYTLTVPLEDKYSVYKSHMKEKIVELLGGRVAEQLIFKDYSAGASNDIQRATQIARDMVTRYGMSDTLGPIVFGSEHSNDEVFLGRDFNNTKNFSEETASKIDAEIKKIVDEAYNTAESILKENIDKLHATADFLLKHETMDEDQFKALMDENATEEQLVEISKAKCEKSISENQNEKARLESTGNVEESVSEVDSNAENTGEENV